MSRLLAVFVTLMCLSPLGAWTLWANSQPEVRSGLPYPVLEPASSTKARQPVVARVVELHLGDDLNPAVAARIRGHLAATPGVRLQTPNLAPNRPPPDLRLAIGQTPLARQIIPDAELVDLDPEGFVLRSRGPSTLVARGVSGTRPRPTRGRGNAYAAYALLEHLGFAFLHPLAPTTPQALPATVSAVSRTESPRWPARGLQLHTMHPTELTELLQGFGAAGPGDVEGWADQLPQWDLFLEWMLANRQNRVHWVLLWAKPWASFGDSSLRQSRLASLVDRGHAFGLDVGVDVPIRLHQQHAWRLVRSAGSLSSELQQIRDRIDYLMAAGFDYLATESGTTEFTAPDASRMLAWMNEVARHLDTAHGKQAFIKIHASSGQQAEGFVDPETGEPLNFNFLPQFADPRLGVMPHTVQHYGLDDPAPTYGNDNFEHIRTFLRSQAGRRPVVWHPESAYWVSFDIDVPLFLPIYAERRLHDLRQLATDEVEGRMGPQGGDPSGARMDGQITFSSGWEWAYWLGEVVAARASWNPMTDLDDEAALARSLDPIVAPFGDAAPAVRALLSRTIEMQRDLLIEGEIDGRPPADVRARNGQAYLQGFDALDDVSELARHAPGLHLTMTQPERLGLIRLRNPLHTGPDYSDEVEPLLDAMDRGFAELAFAFETLRNQIPEHARPLFDDMADAARMTSLRATQVHALYDYVDGYWDSTEPWRNHRLATAKAALATARTVVQRREQAYRVDPERLAGWGSNSTSYGYGYLWTVRSLYYWERDEQKATVAPLSPCHLNIVSPIAAGIGEGTLSRALDHVATWLSGVPGVGGLAQCLGAPVAEPLRR